MKIEVRKNTDQLNYEDFLGGATRVVTITKVDKGRKEAQYDISIEGDARYWRPPATVLKLLVLAYGEDDSNWIGKRAQLFGDPDVKMKGVKVGGIRVSHLSHLDGPLTESLTVTRGQSAIFTIHPITERDMKILDLRAEYKTATPERQAAIVAEVNEINEGAAAL